MDQNQSEEQEARALSNRLQAAAAQWHQRLADPLLQAQIKAGRIQVNPLVKQLLLAYPQAGKK